MADKIYFNGAFLKETQYSIKLDGKAADIIAEIEKYTKPNGRIRLEIKKRREADKNGNTHYIEVDTWEPNQSTTLNGNDINEPLSDLPF